MFYSYGASWLHVMGLHIEEFATLWTASSGTEAPMTGPTDIVQFPGPPTFRAGSAVPPVRVRLPLEAEPRRGVFSAMAASWGVTALIMALIAMAAVAAQLSEPVPTPWTKATAGWALASLSAAIGVQLVGTAVTYFLDLMRAPPFLVITSQGIFDRRMLERMSPWSDVMEARSWAGQFAICLRLRQDLNVRQNPFRLVPVWRRRPDEVYIPVRFLTVRPHDLVHCIATLVQQHGGKVAASDGVVTPLRARYRASSSLEARRRQS
jgi:hypothetical protein